MDGRSRMVMDHIVVILFRMTDNQVTAITSVRIAKRVTYQ